MKYATYAEYDPRAVALAAPAFLTVWAGLASRHEELVLVGGLVPHFICTHPTGGDVLPRPATTDVDFGIALGASAGQYGSLSADLGAQGFHPSKVHPTRFEKYINGFPVYIDFLVERAPATQGTVIVDDVPANILPGIDRALATARTQRISGPDLFGAPQSMDARICEIGPFLVLKLRAFANRQQPKDAFDILYAVRHYDGGVKSAAAQFAMEGAAGNAAFADARNSLRLYFRSADASGPVRAAHFLLGEAQTNENEDTRLRRAQIKQDTISAALELESRL